MGNPLNDNKEIRDEFLKLYKKNGCLLYKTCNELGIKRDKVGEWVRIYKDFRENKKVLDELVNDEVIMGLKDNIKKGNVLSQIFWLKHRRSEEWGDKTQGLEVSIKPLWFDKPKKTDVIDGEVVKPEQLNAKVSTPDDESK